MKVRPRAEGAPRCGAMMYPLRGYDVRLRLMMFRLKQNDAFALRQILRVEGSIARPCPPPPFPRGRSRLERNAGKSYNHGIKTKA